MAKNNRPRPPTNYDFESTNQKYDFTKLCTIYNACNGNCYRYCLICSPSCYNEKAR